MKLIKISVLSTPTTKDVKSRFSVFNSRFNETANYFDTKLIKQTNATNFIGTSYIEFDKGKITDLDKFLKNPYSVVLR